MSALRNHLSPWLSVFESSSPCVPVKSGLLIHLAYRCRHKCTHAHTNSTKREKEVLLPCITVGITHVYKPTFAWKQIPGYLKCLVITWPNMTVALHYYHTFIFSSKLQEEKSVSKEKNWLVKGIQAIKYFLLVQVLVFVPGSSSGSSITLLNNFQRPLACTFVQEHSRLALKLPLQRQTICFSVFYGVTKRVDFYRAVCLWLLQEEPSLVPAPQRPSALGAPYSNVLRHTFFPTCVSCSSV